MGIIENESKRLSKLSDNMLKLSALETDGETLIKSEFRLDKQIVCSVSDNGIGISD